MNRKYLLRGIGIGILIGVLIMFGAGKLASGTDETSEGVSEDAAVAEMSSEDTTVTTEATTEEVTTEATTEEATTEATTEEVTTEATTEEVTTEATTEEVTTEEVTTEATTEATTEETTTESTTASGNGDGVTIAVTSGMYSDHVAALLEEEGVVEDGDDFNTWLCANGYDAKLHVGTFTIPKGADYETIATLLTTEGE